MKDGLAGAVCQNATQESKQDTDMLSDKGWYGLDLLHRFRWSRRKLVLVVDKDNSFGIHPQDWFD